MKIIIAHCDYYTWDGELTGGLFTAFFGDERIAVGNSFSELKSVLTSEYLDSIGIPLNNGIEIGGKFFTREALNDEIIL